MKLHELIEEASKRAMGHQDAELWQHIAHTLCEMQYERLHPNRDDEYSRDLRAQLRCHEVDAWTASARSWAMVNHINELEKALAAAQSTGTETETEGNDR